jgi:hypothetical protein
MQNDGNYQARSSIPISENANPGALINGSGYHRNLDKRELVAAFAAIEEAGFEIPVPRRTTITEEVNLHSVLQVIDAIVAFYFYKYPNLFTVDDEVTDVMVTPIEIKSYLTLLFLNRMRSVNLLQGQAIGTIPWLSETSPMPRSMFEMLSALAPVNFGNERGALLFNYDNEFMISDDNIFGPSWIANNLNTPALLSLQSPALGKKGVHVLRKDPTTGEVEVLESSPLMAQSLSTFWETIDDERIFFAINQMCEMTLPFNLLPTESPSADFFVCSRALDAVGRPANQLMCPFSQYDAAHATVFSFFKRCEIKVTMNQKMSAQAPTRPNDFTSAAQYPKEYLVGVFVSQGDRLETQETQYLGSAKYYSYDGQKCNVAPQYKKVDPEIIKAHAVDAARSLIGALAQATRSNTIAIPTNAGNLYPTIITSPRFYRQLTLCFVSKIFKAVQLQTLGFMTNPSFTALPNLANQIKLFGSSALIASSLAPVVENGNLILPFFEFGNLSNIDKWYNMDRVWNDPLASTEKLYASTLVWENNTAEQDEYLVRFGDGKIVDAAWIAAYEALEGPRSVPFYALTCARDYEQFLDAYSVATGMLLSLDPVKLGGSTMLTYTKYVKNIALKRDLPVFDLDDGGGLKETPFPREYLLTIERLLFSNLIFGLTISESTVAFSSLDIEEDMSDDLNEFVFASPLNSLPGSQMAFSVFNSECANSNGVIQKAFAANVTKNHSEPIYVSGVPILPKQDESHCWWSAITSTLGSIGDAVLTGVNTFIDTGNPVSGVLDTVSSLATDIFTSDQNLFAQGSPALKAPQLLRQKGEGRLYQHNIHPHKNNMKKQKESKAPRTSAPPTSKKNDKSKNGKPSTVPSKNISKKTPNKSSPPKKPPQKSVQQKKSPSTVSSKVGNLNSAIKTRQIQSSVKKFASKPLVRPSQRPKQLKPSRVIPDPVLKVTDNKKRISVLKKMKMATPLPKKGDSKLKSIDREIDDAMRRLQRSIDRILESPPFIDQKDVQDSSHTSSSEDIDYLS